ncbi:g10351 [Coccomyxa elongata]
MAPSISSDTLLDTRSYYFIVILAILLVLIGIVYQRKGKRGDTVLLVGPCGAGKTTLFLQLEKTAAGIGTVASMQENIGMAMLPTGKEGRIKEVRLVDIPGHPRVFSRALSEHVDRARGIVFMVDSVDFMPQKEQIAEQLYDVLAHPVVNGRRLPVLLACNKSDCGTKAHTMDFIRKRLEKAIDQLRSTRLAISEDSRRNEVLGRADEAFSFAGLAKAHGARLSVADLSALEGEVGSVQQFIFGMMQS